MMTLEPMNPKDVRRGIVRGVDFNALAKRLWALDAMRAERPLPEIRWRACYWKGPEYVAGRAWRTHIIMRIGVGASVEAAAEVLLHELVHAACPRREHHGALFRRRLVATAREAFGVFFGEAVDVDAPDAGEAERTKDIRAYALDTLIRKAMVACGAGAGLQADPLLRVAPEPVPTPEEKSAIRAERAAKRAAKRRAHAEAMAADWERRLKRARTAAAKWRRVVRGYEKREALAAKRRSS